MSPDPAPQLEWLDVVKSYEGRDVVGHVSGSVAPGEFLAILGPSGSGKSSLLSMSGGHSTIEGGDIRVTGQSIVGRTPNDIDVVTVFQHYALFQHLTARENIAFGLRMRKVPREVAAPKIDKAVALLGLERLQKRKVSQLSGGEMQRVATARALALDPSVILMDEPLGALDRAIKVRLQTELREALNAVNTTTVYVTHDQGEALSMADRVMVMNHGRVEQVDTPKALYESPATEFVARFVGGANVLSGAVVESSPSETGVEVAGRRLVCRGSGEGSDARVAVRPELVRLRPADDALAATDGSWCHDGVVRRVQYFGTHSEYAVETLDGSGGVRVAVVEHGPPRFTDDQTVSVIVPPLAGVVVARDNES